MRRLTLRSRATAFTARCSRTTRTRFPCCVPEAGARALPTTSGPSWYLVSTAERARHRRPQRVPPSASRDREAEQREDRERRGQPPARRYRHQPRIHVASVVCLTDVERQRRV